ncbi:MAG TPA: alpha/beta fold hydrolase [Rhizomicrobium sp.]|jgi:pimeloyl-ACP methyl ester carboxylesterase
MDKKVPLLLLPGMICDGAFWRAQVTDLADISAPRVMEFGALESFEAMADKVLSEAPERFALAGHSMGGRVAQEVYRKAPHRVLRLALLATDFRGHVSEEARLAEEARRNGMLAKVAAEGMESFAKGWVKMVVAPANMGNAALVNEVVAMMARQTPDLLAAHTLAGLQRRDYTEMLERIACPALLAPGDGDTLRPVSVHEEMMARIPGSRLAVIRNSGHMVAMEQPQQVTAALREWLSL